MKQQLALAAVLLLTIQCSYGQPDPRRYYSPFAYEFRSVEYWLPQHGIQPQWTHDQNMFPVFPAEFENSSVLCTFRAFVNGAGSDYDTEIVHGELTTRNQSGICRMGLYETLIPDELQGLTDPLYCSATRVNLTSDQWFLFPFIRFSGAAFRPNNGPFFDELIYRVDAWVMGEEVFQ